MNARVKWFFLAVLAFAAEAGAQVTHCEVTSSAPQVDYGRLSRATMAVDASGDLVLPARSITLSVRCPEPQDMTVFFRAQPADTKAFRFTGQGRFGLRLRGGVLDGEAVDLGQLERQGDIPIRVASSLPWQPDQGIAPVKAGRVATGRVFIAQVDIDATVKAQAMSVRDATRWTILGEIDAVGARVTRELSLQADVLAGRCQVEVTRHLSFGRIRSTDLDPGGASTPLPSTQNGELQVTCDAPMPFALRLMRDERAGTAVVPTGLGLRYTDASWMGLGQTPAGENIGAYVLHWGARATSDRGELHATRSVDGGRTWSQARDPIVAVPTGTERLGYAGTGDAAAGPSPLTALHITLDAKVYLAPRHLLSLNEAIEADGLVTFEIVY
ncbi:MAG TPA: hypothetical protein VM621_17455 [Luteibacter sp.]|uniref:hypothetical protein n=1 Tax=Luteibacter sp. TaxID=1886636 RepID=UPI002C466917|nr:hypothetical protein [Luteibacter sp.]HVI56831.1 hypothetical protein [Luteibacter sp.]